MVYVLSINNKPLMPCKSVIARLLLKSGKAKVVKKCPFTIKLTYDSTEYTQPLTLGVDTGSCTVGTAVCGEKGNIVYASEVEIRNDIHGKMEQRSSYRRNRRNRKTRYRKLRFLNRKNSKRENRFSPTMISKFNSHIKEIEFIKSILPITKLVLETGKFDSHLMKNPALSSEKVRHWGYQRGLNYGFENTRLSVLDRDSYKCQICGKKNCQLEVHHKVFRSNGGSDEHENLITLCHECHDKIHKGKLDPKWRGKKSVLKHATQMNSIRIQLLKHYPDAIETFGYVTFANRHALNVEKEHYIDACVIASGGNKFNIKCDLFQKRSVSKGDYQQTFGSHSEKRYQTGKVFGFRKFDKVRYKGNEYFIKGKMSSGYAILMDIHGNTQKFTNPKMPKFDKFKRLSARSTVLTVCKQIA
jgi:5-methylcytosine-specific restriction endonuclease McrA